LHAQNSENVYFFLRNKHLENENNPQQTALKEKNNPQQTALKGKPRRLYHRKMDSLFNSSSDDDTSSGSKKVILFLSHPVTGM
jgi:hypothetical protein